MEFILPLSFPGPMEILMAANFSMAIAMTFASVAWSASLTDARICDVREYGAIPGDAGLDTQGIQAAIQDCATGGGTVLLEGGKFRSGGITLRSGITLRISKDAVLEGSTDWKDYFNDGWDDAFIQIFDVKNVRIDGGGVIDGMDCRNPKGEEGFRGPHAIYLKNSSDIVLSDITVRHAGNYNIIARNSSRALFEKVKVRGGHDGFNAWNSSDFTLTECDIRTGDDGIAGTGNRNFTITDCLINSSCNGFRFACLGLIVRRCRIWGPGEFKHLVSGRNNLLGAFVHFSPKSKDPVPVSDNWLIEDVVVDSAIALYLYDYDNGLWQKGGPVAKVRFNRVKATRIEQPVVIIGDGKGSFVFNDVEIQHALKNTGVERGATPESDGYAFAVTRAARLELNHVTLSNAKSLSRPAVTGRQLGLALIDDVRIRNTTHANPIQFPDAGTLVAKAYRWTFDRDGQDSVGGAHGVLSGGATIESVPGALGGGALALKGAGRMTLGQEEFKRAFQGYTAVFRFMPESVQGIQALLEEGDQERGFAVRLQGNKLEATLRAGARSLTASRVGVTAGRWNFGAVTWEAGVLKVYLDNSAGVETAVDSGFREIPSHTGGLAIGEWDGTSAFATAASPFQGKIDDVRVYRGAALDSLRIASLAVGYQGNVAGLSRPAASRPITGKSWIQLRGTRLILVEDGEYRGGYVDLKGSFRTSPDLMRGTSEFK